MQITNYKKRSICDQTGAFCYSNEFIFSDTTGDFEFGISGDSVINFHFISGKIYDKDYNYLESYNVNIPVQLSGQIGPEVEDCYIYNKPAYIGKTKATGEFDYFYYNSTSTVQATTKIIGQDPNYIYNLNGTFNSGEILTGTFVNQNPEIAFRIFSGVIDQTDPYFSLLSYPTGDITSYGNFTISCDSDTTITSNLPLIFYTNFGDIEIEFNLTGATSGLYYLISSPATGGYIKSLSSGSWTTTYSLPVNNGNYVDFHLSGIGGTISGLVTGYTTGLASGNLADSGSLIYDYFTGRAVNYTWPIGQTGSSNCSGILSGLLPTGEWTGAGDYFFSGSGYASGFATISDSYRYKFWNLYTGDVGYPLYNYSASGWVNNGNYNHSGHYVDYPYYSILNVVSFNSYNLITGGYECANLTVTGSGNYPTGYILHLSGVI